MGVSVRADNLIMIMSAVFEGDGGMWDAEIE